MERPKIALAVLLINNSGITTSKWRSVWNVPTVTTDFSFWLFTIGILFEYAFFLEWTFSNIQFWYIKNFREHLKILLVTGKKSYLDIYLTVFSRSVSQALLVTIYLFGGKRHIHSSQQFVTVGIQYFLVSNVTSVVTLSFDLNMFLIVQ